MQSQSVDHDPTNTELLSAIQGFANYVQTNMVTKTEFNELKDQVSSHEQILNLHTTLLENIATNVHTIHTDHKAVIEWLKRHDKKLEEHETDIKQLKWQLNEA